MLQYLVFLGAAVNLFSVFVYIRGILSGEIKPNRVSWLLWSLVPLIATAAALSDGVGWAVLPVFMSGFGPMLVFAASFLNPDAYWKLGRLDYICGFLSAMALILWGITNKPEIAIVFAIASDGLAAVPTLVKGWRYPETESAAPFVGGAFSALTAFAAIKLFNFSEVAFPIYLLIVNSLLIFSIYRKQIFKK